MTAVVSRERAKATWLTGAAGLLILAVAFVMMACAAPSLVHFTGPCATAWRRDPGGERVHLLRDHGKLVREPDGPGRSGQEVARLGSAACRHPQTCRLPGSARSVTAPAASQSPYLTAGLCAVIGALADRSVVPV